MGRLGERDPEAAIALLDRAAGDEAVELAGFWTHFATADEPGSGLFEEQLARFAELAERARAAHPGIVVHAANSAATLAGRRSDFDMVRCGVAIYGLDPFGRSAAERGLAPALSLHSYVADVKRFAPGSSAGYGATWHAAEETFVGVVPIGYGDGVRRALGNNGDVLAGGRRYPIVGTVSMDNLTIDLGPEPAVEPGDPVVLIGSAGRRGDHRRAARGGARDDQLRGHLRDLGASAAGVPPVSAASGGQRAAAVADRIAGSPSGRRVARSAVRRASGVFVVGGAVRDAILGRDGRGPRPRLRGRSGRARGRPRGRRRRAYAFQLSEQFGTWRVAWRGGGHADVTGLRGAGARRRPRAGATSPSTRSRCRSGRPGTDGGADRPVRRARRPRRRHPARRLGSQLRGRPAAGPARGAVRRPARVRDRAGHRGARPRRRRPRRRARRRAPARRAPAARRRARPAARYRAARRARGDRRRPARARRAARRRADGEPPPRRLRPHDRGARQPARGRARPRALRRRERRRASPPCSPSRSPTR